MRLTDKNKLENRNRKIINKNAKTCSNEGEKYGK